MRSPTTFFMSAASLLCCPSLTARPAVLYRHSGTRWHQLPCLSCLSWRPAVHTLQVRPPRALKSSLSLHLVGCLLSSDKLETLNSALC